MTLLKELKGSFVGGQVSPELQNRIDLEKFNTFLKEAKNTQIKPEGGISNRAGTVFIGKAKGATFLLTINVNVTANIIVNGIEYKNVSTKTIELDADSEYTYEVSAVGYETKTGGNTITSNETVDVELDEDTNTYVFSIDNGTQGATITINEEERSSITATAGTQITWKVEKEGFVTQTDTFFLSQDKTEEVILSPVKYKIFSFYYDTNTQSLKLELFKEVDSYNFKDVVATNNAKCFIADGSMYQVGNGSFTKVVDGGCSSCSGTFYVKNGAICKLGSATQNSSYTWDRICFCQNINRVFALTTSGDLYMINTDSNQELTNTITFINDNVVDLKGSNGGCMYCKKYYDTAYRCYLYCHDGTTNSQMRYTGSNEDNIHYDLSSVGMDSFFGSGDAGIYVLGTNLFVGSGSNRFAYGYIASGNYNNLYTYGYRFYYIDRDRKLILYQNASSETVDNGGGWTDVSANLSAKYLSRNVGCASLAINNNNLYFIDQYYEYDPEQYIYAKYKIDAPTLINSNERFIEVYTLYHEQSTNVAPTMFAIARDI